MLCTIPGRRCHLLSRWAWAFLTLSVHSWAVSLCPFCVTSSYFHIFHAFFFVFGFCQEISVHSHGPTAVFAWRCTHWGKSNLTLGKRVFENQPAVQACLLPRVIYQWTLPKRSPNRPKSSLLKGRVVILLFGLFLHLGILNSTTHANWSQGYLWPSYSWPALPCL